MLPRKLDTHQDVIDGLKHFEYENPVPLSRKPSEAIRQAIADVRHDAAVRTYTASLVQAVTTMTFA